MSIKEDKNFIVRVKAAVAKRLHESGFIDIALNGSRHWEHFDEVRRKFFDSLDDLDINYLNGEKPLKQS